MSNKTALRPLGSIMTGSLTEGFVMRVTAAQELERLKTGRFVSIKSGEYSFFSLITDLSLQVSHPDILLFPPSEQETLLNNVLQQKDIYATAILRPLLVLDRFGNKMAVKMVPTHFSKVYEAQAKDVAQIFGDKDDPTQKYFHIGNPLDMQTPVCIELDKLVERSNGIFGKTGTGKTFLTRLVLAGLIKHRKAVNLNFDMHSEYG